MAPTMLPSLSRAGAAATRAMPADSVSFGLGLARGVASKTVNACFSRPRPSSASRSGPST